MEMWCRVKSVATGKLSTVVASKLYEIREVSKNMWERRELSVKSVEEFKARAASEKSPKYRTEYGILEGDFMYRYRILCVAASREELENGTGGRVHSSKRLSNSDTKIKLKYFLDYEEYMKSEKHERDSKVKRVRRKNKKNEKAGRGKSTEDKLLEQFDKKMLQKNKAKKPTSEKEETKATDNKRSVSSCNEQVSRNAFEVIAMDASDDNENDVNDTFITEDSVKEDAVVNVAPGENVNTEESVQGEDFLNIASGGNVNGGYDELITEDSSVKEVENHASIRASNGIEEDITSSEQIATNDESVETLKLRIQQLEEELKKRNNSQNKTLAQEKLLTKIAAQTQQISEKVGNGNSSASCRLKDLKLAVPLEEGDESITVPDGCIYVGGDKKFVKAEDVALIDETCGSFIQKGEELFKLVAGSSIGGFSKTKRGVKANAGKGIKLAVMPTNVIKSVTVILRKGFTWLEGEKPSHDDINTFFRKQPGEVRRRAKPNTKKTKKTKNDSESDSGSEVDIQRKPKSNKRKTVESDSDSDVPQKNKKKNEESDYSSS
ncbi:hypothetical protein KUF71_004251 [Frankliniella fusca]|uniref:Uncharacterized protein n=1 Tax=Frankliniella fusca TaxID=407009 RepID=A0AAE1GXN9_9NEOP|nr:hypothetical protein KUF71_004251 [Frankliniella fusca]